MGADALRGGEVGRGRMKMISARMRDGYGRLAHIYLNPDNINYVRDNYDGETSVVFNDGGVVSIKDDAGAIAEQWWLCKSEGGGAK